MRSIGLRTTLLSGALLAVGGAAEAQTVLLTESFDTFGLCGTTCGNACPLPAASGWVNASTDDFDWTVNSGGTGSSDTGPSADHTSGTPAGRYLYTESSSLCSNDTAELLSPVVDLTGTTSPVLRFWYHMYGSDQGTLHVDLLEGAVNPVRRNDVIPPITDDLDRWQQTGCIPLDPLAGPTQVVFRGQTGNGFRSDMAIDDVEVVDPGTDVALSAVRVRGNCAGAAIVEVDVDNLGLAVSGATVQYTVSGGAPVTAPLPPLGLCEQTTFAFPVPANLVAGTATVTATVIVPGDVDTTNDSATVVKEVRPVVSSIPYAEDFEAGPGGWGASGTPLWAHGVPSDAVIGDAQSGTQAWVTDLSGNYPNNARAFLESVCFDGTSMANPRLDFYIEIESEFSWDGAQVQTSTDGVNWLRVGSTSPGWYNDGTIAGLAFTGSQQGFTGRANTGNGSNGWRRVAQDLGNGTAGNVFQVRVVFGSDTSVTDEGVAIDTVTVFDNPPRLDITDATLPGVSAYPPGASDVFVQALLLENFVRPTSVQAISLQKQGTLPDAGVTAARLWLDDGDGVPEPGGDDAQVAAPATFSGGITTFTLTPALDLPAGGAATLFVTFDLGISVGGGLTFGTEIGAPGLVSLANAQPVTFPDGVARSPLSSTFASVDVLPFADGFEGGAINRRAFARQGTYPTATSTGTQVGTSALTANDAVVAIVESAGGVDPNGGSNLAAIAFLNGPATGAIDYAFDLSSYDVNVDDVFVEVFWYALGQLDDPEDHVFVSLDGGLTWTGSLFDFDFTSPAPSAWTPARIDLSALLRAANQTFTNNVVVRLQAAGGPTEATLFDDAWVGIPERLRLERIAGAPIPSGGVDDLGRVPGGAPVPVQFTVHNDGQRDLTVGTGTIAFANPTNVAFVASHGADLVVPPGGSETFTVTLEVPSPGPFSIELGLNTNDPRLTGAFTLFVTGVGVFEPDIALSTSAGDPLPSGATQSFGRVRVGGLVTADYVLENRGGGPLTLTATPAIALANAANVSGMVSAVPRVLPPLAAEAFSTMLTPAARGPFSVDLVIESDDPDEGTYVVTATGTAVAPDMHVRRAQVDLPSGSDDDLGLVEVGVSSRLEYTIENLGDEDLRLSGTPRVAVVGLVGAVTATVTAAPTSTVTPGASTTFVVEVTATDVDAFAFDLVIGSDDPDAPYTISVAGIGYVPAPEIQVSRGGSDVPNGATEEAGASLPGVAQTFTFTLTNPGTLDLELSDVVITNQVNSEAVISALPSTTIAPGDDVLLELTFAPREEGPYSFDLVIESNDADEGTFTITIRGTGDSQAPEIAVQQPAGTDRADGATIDLGEVGVGEAQSLEFTVLNEGAGPLSLTGDPRVSLDNVTNLMASVDSQPDSPIAAGASTTFTLGLTPAAAGAFSVVVSVPNDDGNEGAYRVTVAGVAVGDGGGPGPTNPGEEDGGCGCTASESGREPGASAAAVLALGALFALRRRRR